VHHLSSQPVVDKIIDGTKTLDVLFVHGSLWNDELSACGWRRTWMQRDNPAVCWPEDWVAADLKRVRILSVSYDDVILRKKDIPKQEIADVIAHELCDSLFRRYNKISCHFTSSNLSDCSPDPFSVLLCVYICVCVSLCLSQQKLLFCVVQGRLGARQAGSCCAGRA
jgi:hypothetical protein